MPFTDERGKKQFEPQQKATIRLVPRDSPTITAELDKDEKWNYYIQTYMMCAPTEGIPLDRCSKVFLNRTYPREKDLADPSHSTVRENMEVRICVNTYRLFFMPHTEDLVVKDPRHWSQLPKAAVEKRRDMWQRVQGKLGWVAEAGEEEVKRREGEWERFKEGGEGVGEVGACGPEKKWAESNFRRSRAEIGA